ncbi:hypothetical protein JANAI62_00270 [Jannaschia pagri]|uniref:DUF177 domain-containing protein n=1 Tax=Jannaschia pagri TaxID=2829797 RepID=A0ABQ4NGS7_9RHOB|nr:MULTISPECIES: DUF177 domain-containing protein [unclassified Jannaschia]GIT90491.1 hypothetical protein JANAI61_09490 [Jannaschia sp. AI_61]GIT93404.1 hypothetical protein JANAI62_00270 [Jannaschia sp. AI_62]
MTPVLSHRLRLADLPQRRATHVRLVPDSGALTELADQFDVSELRKVRFEGTLAPLAGKSWVFDGTLGATVVQPCRVTGDPVTTRIDEPVQRRYLADFETPEAEEAEMPEDDTAEPLPDVIDMGDLLEEVLALSIPAFPRSNDAETLNVSAAPEGAAPLTDEAVKPFAGLAALRAKMQDTDDGTD